MDVYVVFYDYSHEGQRLFAVAADIETAKMIAEAEIGDELNGIGVWEEDREWYLRLALDDFDSTYLVIAKMEVVS